MGWRSSPRPPAAIGHRTRWRPRTRSLEPGTGGRNPAHFDRCYDRCSTAANPGNFISGRDAHAVIVRYGERREHSPVADFKLLKDVMEVHLDGAVDNIQPPPNFLVRQPFGHQTHDLALPACQHPPTLSP